ncbi:MAG TPA: hypothetical protein VG015_05780, partial [Candidatus Dormibacteraeota bacterium]|nr:hypothetical protein [Candidatus Dormibacteraeota bacterium]
MSSNSTDFRKLTELIPARRNRYYYGKMMDVLHFTMEQRYVLSKEWLYNRAVLGPGVVCGLNVEPFSNSAGNGVVVRSGLAIDGWGREIIVPNDITLVPLALTDDCGRSSNQVLPSQLMIQICYSECQTDFSPALASDDCGCGDCEAGTIVESYCLKVVSGTGPAVTDPCLDGVLTDLKAGKLHDVLCTLSQVCPPDPADPCLTLANVTVAADGSLSVDSCSPRLIAPTNRVLAQLVACLAQCCSGSTTTMAVPLQVAGMSLVQVTKKPETDPGTVLGSLDPPASIWDFTADPKIGLPNALDIKFSGAPLDYSSVTLGLPPNSPGTFQVEGHNLGGAHLFQLAADTVRLFVKDGMKGRYRVTLVGTPDASSGQKAIVSAATASDPATDLDGEIVNPSWPTGEGVPGGNFGPID